MIYMYKYKVTKIKHYGDRIELAWEFEPFPDGSICSVDGALTPELYPEECKKFPTQESCHTEEFYKLIDRLALGEGGVEKLNELNSGVYE